MSAVFTTKAYEFVGFNKYHLSAPGDHEKRSFPPASDKY